MADIKITQQANPFKKCNVPYYGFRYILSTMNFPKKLEFNKTYYKYVDSSNTLLAFRILAYSIIRTNDGTTEINYLVQFPNEEPIWSIGFLNTRSTLFSSAEQFLSFNKSHEDLREYYCVDLDWTSASMMFPRYRYAAVVGFKYHTWVWGNSCPIEGNDAFISHFFANEDGFFVCINETDEKGKRVYLSEEECIKGTLNNMVIKDFAKEPIKVTINVLPNQPKIHTLRFIEE